MKNKQKVQEEIYKQFAKIYAKDDWKGYLSMANYYFKEAACLKTKHITTDKNGLRIRNSIKRLYLGVGVELMLKAIYLKNGFVINKVRKKERGETVFKFKDIELDRLEPNDTISLDELLTHLSKVIGTYDKNIERGLIISRIFRNKEAHSTTVKHNYDKSNYSDIETSIMELYKIAFNKSVKMKIGFDKNSNGYFN